MPRDDKLRCETFTAFSKHVSTCWACSDPDRPMCRDGVKMLLAWGHAEHRATEELAAIALQLARTERVHAR